MDSLHKKVLCNKTSAIMLRISNPTVLSAFLSHIFTFPDREEIQARHKSSGATAGTQALIHLLAKRGPNAFQSFIDALKDDAIKQDDLAAELEKEERRLSGQADMKRSQNLPTDSGEPMEEHECSTRGLSLPPYSAPASSSNSEIYKFSPVLQSPVYSHAHELPEIGRESNQEQSSPPVITLGTLVKDIPYSLRAKIERMMNVTDTRKHDWRGVAGAMGMSTEDVRQLEGDAKGRMTGLFEIMIQTKKSVKDLLEFMKNTDVQRLDVADEIRKGCKLPAEDVMETDSAETQVSDTKRSQSLPTDSGEPMEEHEYSTRGLSPPPYSAPASSSNSEIYKFSPVLQSPVYSHAHELPEIGRESNQEQSSPPVITLGTLVKDIPYSLRAKIERMMNVTDNRNHDWRGVAGAMGMSTEEVRQLEGEAKGRMTGLFDIMIQTKKSVKDLLELMKNTDVQRLDVADEIRKGCKLPEDVVETDSAETQVSDSKEVAYYMYGQECSKSPTNLKPLPPNPIQESQCAKDTNSKKVTCSPVQEEHGDSKGRGQAELDTKPDARMPSQVEDDDDHKQSHQLPCQEENNVACY